MRGIIDNGTGPVLGYGGIVLGIEELRELLDGLKMKRKLDYQYPNRDLPSVLSAEQKLNSLRDSRGNLPLKITVHASQ